MANLPTTQKANTIREMFYRPDVKKQLLQAIPKHLSVDRMLRVAMTSIQRTPKLMDCTPRSLLGAVMTATQLGLEVDQFLGQAYLVPFSNKGVLEAQLIPGYRGYIALARRSGEVQTVSAQVVYQNDRFTLQYGLEDKLEHVPADGDRGEPKGAYVVFRYKDGSYSFDYMSKADIEAVRARSKASGSGPWVTDWAEMAKKTVIKRHIKLAPLSVEFAKAAALEDTATAGESQMTFFEEGQQGEDPAIDVQSEEAFDFAATIPAGTNPERLEQFLSIVAKNNATTPDEIKANAAKPENRESFWKGFIGWLKNKEQAEKLKADEGKPTQTTPIAQNSSKGEASGVQTPSFRDEFINLRKPGFSTWVYKNKERLAAAPVEIQAEAKEKWAGFYGNPWPLDPKPEAQEQTKTTPPATNGKTPYVTCPEGGRAPGKQFAAKLCMDTCEQFETCDEAQSKALEAGLWSPGAEGGF